MKKEKKYHFQKPEEVILELGSSEHGLSSKDAKQRLERDGFNELPELKRDSSFIIFLHQFSSPLIYILLSASVVVLAIGEWVDAIVIVSVLTFNAIVGTAQEGKAQNTFLALRKFIKGKATILRDAEETITSDREVVVGDIIVLREGEKIPADARIIHANSFQVEEAALTGESMPTFKDEKPIRMSSAKAESGKNMLFKGTTVISGHARAIVVATGLKTFIGKIAQKTLTIEEDFPLKNEIKKLSRFVIIFVSIVSILLLILEFMAGEHWIEIFKTIVALSVSVIPEGLPIVMTLVLAAGVWRIGKKKVLIKKLQAVEVLGETKIIAVDKTGTITKNELNIERVYTNGKTFTVKGNGYEPVGEIFLEEDLIDAPNHPELLLAGKIAALNSSASLILEKRKSKWRMSGDPTEGSMLAFAKKIGFHQDDLLNEMPIISEIPFHYDFKFHASLHKLKEENFIALTGAPEVILKLCNREWGDDGPIKLEKQKKEEIKKVLAEMSRKGLRVVGFAYTETKDDSLDKKKIPELIFGGFFGIKDVIREEVCHSVKQVNDYGIDVVMITGDHEITARAIAIEAGICTEEDEVMNGEEIEKLNVVQLAKEIKNIKVFARITPENKLKIIEAFKSNGTVVAMTGDGVNDALSLTAADIGIGMGKIGTDVAKEASDLILLDDNFGNIIHGVEEGREILRKIKKVVLYLFATNLGEVLTILAGLAIGFPLPILAIQVLWLNLVTDGFLDVALALSPQEKGVRKIFKKVSIIDKITLQRMFFMAVPMAIGTLWMFSQNYQNDLPRAWTISLALLAVFQWFNAWNCQSEKTSIFKIDLFANKLLIGATLIVASLQGIAIYTPFFQKILKTVPISVYDWIWIICIALSIVVIEEIRKLLQRKGIKFFS